MTALHPVYTAHDAMIIAGVNDADNFNGESSTERFAEDLFDNNFMTCMDKTYKDLDGDFKLLSILTAIQEQIHMVPRVTKCIKAFI